MLTIKEKQQPLSADRSVSCNGIDLMKFLGAIMVFTMHILPFYGESPMEKYMNYALKNYLFRLAVPFYFVSAGFFLFRKMHSSRPDPILVRDYCFRMLRLFALWQLLLFLGGTGHLWYLRETAVAVAIVGFCLYKGMRFRNIWILASVLYLIGMMGQNYYGLTAPLREIPVINSAWLFYQDYFTTTRNGLFMGFLFVLMGVLFAHYEIPMKTRTSFIGLAVSMILMFGEAVIIKYFDLPVDYNMYIFLVPAVFFLFSFCLTLQLKDRPIYRRLRLMSTVIYFCHMFIGLVVQWIILAIDGTLGTNMAKFLYIFCLLGTIAFAFGVEKLSRREKFKWIHWFFS